MWRTQLVDGAKYVTDDTNLLPLLSDLNTSQKIVISTIGNGVVRSTHKKSSLKGKGLQSLAKVNLCKSKCESLCKSECGEFPLLNNAFFNNFFYNFF